MKIKKSLPSGSVPQHTFPKAERCGATIGYIWYNKSAQTHLRQRSDPTSADVLEITSLTLKGAPLLLRDQRGVFIFFIKCVSSLAGATSNILFLCDEAQSVPPCSIQFGPAVLVPAVCRLSADDCVHFSISALCLSVPAFSLDHVHVTRSGLCQWKLKGTSHVIALHARSRRAVHVPRKQDDAPLIQASGGVFI